MIKRLMVLLGWIKSKVIYEWNPLKINRKKKFYQYFINKGDLCFDIGAHLGDRTDTFLHLGAKVVAVEPQPKFINYLNKKFRKGDSFILEPIALSDHIGTMDFYISSANPTLSTLSKGWWQNQLNTASKTKITFDKVIKTEVSTIDELIVKHGLPKFIKVDVEGFEEQVLNGLTHRIDYLSFEFLSFNKEALKACMALLERKGYQYFNWSFRETFVFELDLWGTSKETFESINEYPITEVFSGDVYVKMRP